MVNITPYLFLKNNMAGHFNGNQYSWATGSNSPHITRYYLAAGWLYPHETVLDAACCTGYGSNILSNHCKSVIGIDVDPGCIESANSTWKKDNIEFINADLNTRELPDVDVAVSIETIEHLDDMRHFVSQLKNKVKRAIIVCVPYGGTSFAYKNEPVSPATEKNDFFNEGDVDKLFCDEEWKKFNNFMYGYSYYAIYFKKEPERL